MDQKVISRARRIVAAGIATAEADGCRGAADQIEWIELHFDGYSEPGYEAPECGIVATGNWNDVEGSDAVGRVSALLEKLGVALEWSDEWSECGDCYKLVRTQPDSYGWRPHYAILNECELVCGDCIQSDDGRREEYLATLADNPSTCNTILQDEQLEAAGLAQVDARFENGLHQGMDDDPRAIAKRLNGAGIDGIVFGLQSPSQFYLTFSVWVPEDGLEAAVEALNAPPPLIRSGIHV